MLDFLVMRVLAKYPFLGKLFALVGLLMLPVGAVMLHNFNQLLASPTTTSGSIESLPQDTHDDGTVSYQYRVNGKEYQNSVTVNRSELGLLNPGGTILVHYNSSNPASSVTDGASPHAATVVLTFSVIFLLFPLFTKIAIKREMKRRQRRARI